MKRRFQLGAVMAACFTLALTSGAAHAQKHGSAAQTEGRPPRETPRAQVRPRLPNALPPRGNPNALPPKAIERLQQLPPEKQEQFLRNNERFNSLAPEQQARIRQNLQAWNRLNPAQQQALLDRQHVWEEMTPEQRQYVRQSLFPRWQQLPPPRRQALLQRLHSLRDMSEAERQAKLNDPAFTTGLNPEDREMLGQLAHLHVGMAPDAPGVP